MPTSPRLPALALSPSQYKYLFRAAALISRYIMGPLGPSISFLASPTSADQITMNVSIENLYDTSLIFLFLISDHLSY